MCLNIGTPKKQNFHLRHSNGKLMTLGVPILKHLRVCQFTYRSLQKCPSYVLTMFMRLLLLNNSSSDLSDSDGEVPNNLIPMSARNNPYQNHSSENVAPLSINTVQHRKHLR